MRCKKKNYYLERNIQKTILDSGRRIEKILRKTRENNFGEVKIIAY